VQISKFAYANARVSLFGRSFAQVNRTRRYQRDLNGAGKFINGNKDRLIIQRLPQAEIAPLM
jgi:hypothetical protein